jgi:hypothetical protein
METKPLLLAAAIIGALVAGSILIAFRWQITAAPAYVYRLDRWTGNITVCWVGGVAEGRAFSTCGKIVE